MTKKVFLMMSLMLCTMLGIQAKTTYIPTYSNRLVLVEGGKTNVVENKLNGASLTSTDGLVYCAIVQQVVDEDLVKSIKNAKSLSGWTKVLSGVAAGAEAYSDAKMISGHGNFGDVVASKYANEAQRGARDVSEGAKAEVEDLKTLLVDLLVQNHSDKEMLITDMDRGLVWFILPHSEMTIPLAKGAECHFRLSSAAPLDENVKYINAFANSTLEKYTVDLETEEFWYIPFSKKTAENLRFTEPVNDGYIRVNKKDLTMAAVTKEEFRSLKEASKKK